MIWDDKMRKDMELYPIIEPFVNYTKEKVHNFASTSHKVVADLHYYAKNGKKRMLADTKGGAKDSSKKKVDGADGEASAVDENDTVNYPDKLFSDENIKNGGFMVYLFCKYIRNLSYISYFSNFSHLIRIYWYCPCHIRLHQPSY